MIAKNSKTRSSIFTAIFSLAYTLVNGLMGLIVTKMIISKLGSDFNGINLTALQVVNVLLIFESGYTLSSSVALFSPILNNDKEKIYRIISTIKRSFFRIGIIYFIFGLGFSILYSHTASSNLNSNIIFIVMIMAIIPSGLNLIFATQYTVLYQANQKEYVIYLVKFTSVIIGQLLVMLTLVLSDNLYIIRATMMLPYLIAVFVIIYAGRKKFTLHRRGHDNSLIRGTGDLLIQRIVGVVYTSLPAILISIRIGTITASIYGVYASITSIMRSISNVLISSPRMSLGVLIAENNREKSAEVFIRYQTLVINSITIMTVIYYSLIIDFIVLYSKGFDVSYLDVTIAILFGLIFWVENLHTPSGIVIAMAGKFGIAKRIQILAGIILLFGIVIGFINSNVYIIMVAVLIAAISLAVLEVGYTYVKLLNISLQQFIIDILLCALSAILSICIIKLLNLKTESYIMFIIKAIISFVIALIVQFGNLYIFNKNKFVIITSFIKRIPSLLLGNQ